MEKEIKEIHKTEYMDKELPTVYYHKSILESYNQGQDLVISVSDKSSADALETFKKLRKEVNE